MDSQGILKEDNITPLLHRKYGSQFKGEATESYIYIGKGIYSHVQSESIQLALLWIILIYNC